MVNRYLEKVARWSKTEIGVTAGMGALGGAVGYLPKTEPKYNKKTDKLEEVKRTQTQRVIAGLVGATVGAGAIGLHIHANKVIEEAVHGASRDWYRRDPKGFNQYKQRFYQEEAHRRNEEFSRRATGDVGDHLKKFGVGKSHFKTKADANKHFSVHMRKHHPDRNKGSAESTKKFQELSVARDNIHKSDWFQKLASLNNRYINALW